MKRSETHVSSKSTNENVLSVYNHILEHAYSDSDYWYLCGDDYNLNKLEDFDRADIFELKNDLSNWALNELQIFQGSLENDYSDSHGHLLPTRAYLRGYIMTLANRYMEKEKYVACGLLDLDDELLLGGYIKDKELLEEIKNTLDKFEVLFVDTQPTDENDYYFLKIRLLKIKETINSLIKTVN